MTSHDTEEGDPATRLSAPAVATGELEDAFADSWPADTAVPHEVETSLRSATAKALEVHADELLAHISPSSESLSKRKRVVEYVQKLVHTHFKSIGYEVLSAPPSPTPHTHICTLAHTPKAEIDFNPWL